MRPAPWTRSRAKAAVSSGHNTDVLGFRPALDALVGKQKMPKAAVVLGAGGGARAAVYGLITAGFQHVIVFNRHLHRGEALVRHFARSAAHMELKAKPWHESVLEAELSRTKILINASSVGRNADETPIPRELLPPELLVLDLLYTPKQSRLLREAAAAGAAATSNGDVMLLHQSAAAFGLWTGQAAPMELLAERLEAAREAAVPAAAARHRGRVTQRSGGGPSGVASCGTGERSVALDAVRAASRLCRSVRRDFDERLAVAKDDRSPVTVADLGAQVLVSLALAEAFPADPLMGEEDAQQLRADPLIAGALARALADVRPGIEAPRWTRRWSADAMPAVRGAAGGRSTRSTAPRASCATSSTRSRWRSSRTALPRVAVLGCPNLPSGGRQRGRLPVRRRARRWRLGAAARRSDGTPPRRRPWSTATRTWRAPATRNRSRRRTARRTRRLAIAALLGITAPPVRMDSQAKYGVVARGEASIYLRIPRGGYKENVWDHAAGLLVVEEAGGSCVTWTGGPSTSRPAGG